jgi:hypothetical protein
LAWLGGQALQASAGLKDTILPGVVVAKLIIRSVDSGITSAIAEHLWNPQ